jgi:hypothetical protein
MTRGLIKLPHLSDLIPAPSILWRALPILGLGSALIVLTEGVNRINAALQHDRLLWACGFWFLLVGPATLMLLVPARRWRNWRFFQTTNIDSAWPTALLLSAAFVTVFIAYIEFLILHPSEIERSTSYSWEFMDKRWIVTLFVLSIITVYLPVVFKRLITLALEPRCSSRVSINTSKPNMSWRAMGLTWLNAIACILAGTMFSILYVGPQIASVHSARLDSHEGAHLGALQRMHLGATPYIGAKTQYGPGHQLLTYITMQKSGFTLLGFRLSHMLLNIVGCSILFATMLYSFGWALGIVTILLSLVISPILLAAFFGWGNIFRWMGPVLVGALLPLVYWSNASVRLCYPATTSLGAACGVLAWLAQENSSTTVITAGLVVAAAFSFKRLSLRQTVATISLFLLGLIAVLLLLLIWTVRLENLGSGLALYFRAGVLVSSGLSNTAWSTPLSPWKIPYYLTPYIVIGLTIVTLYGRNPLGDKLEHRRGQILGILAAAAALAPLTMFRADSSHFLGPSTAIAPMIVLVVAYLPGLLFQDARWREASRVMLAVMFLMVYPLPRNFSEFKARVYPNVEAALHGMAMLQGIWQAPEPPSTGTMLIARRLGFTPDVRTPCCTDVNWTFGEFEQLIRGIRDSTAGRAPFVDHIPGTISSNIYFFGDLRPPISFTEPSASLWVDSDMAQWQRELRDVKPECAVSTDANSPLTRLMLDIYGKYTEHKIEAKGNPSVFCRQ